MDLVLPSPGDELCLDERFKGNHAERIANPGVVDIRCGKYMIRPNLLSSEDEVNGVPRLGTGIIKEDVRLSDVAIHKAVRLEGLPDSGKILSAY